MIMKTVVQELRDALEWIVRNPGTHPQNIINVAKEALDKTKKDDWISFETPPPEGDFLVYMPTALHKIQAGWKNRNGVMVFGNCLSFDVEKPSHWMYPPEGPK